MPQRLELVCRTTPALLLLAALVGGLARFSVSAAPAAADSRLSWSTANVDRGNVLDGISCPSASLCVAAGAHGNIVTSTNPAALVWSKPVNIDNINTALDDVSCTTASLCVAGDRACQVLVHEPRDLDQRRVVVVDADAYRRIRPR